MTNEPTCTCMWRKDRTGVLPIRILNPNCPVHGEPQEQPTEDS